ncbi:hypothetical protein AB0I28_01505 [Phytomonospora sp. NPDC050363]
MESFWISMGAGIAVDTALEYPELVTAVVVTGAGTSGRTSPIHG